MSTRYLPYWLIAPALLFLAAFFLYPAAQVTFMAFTRGGEFSLVNFERMASHWKFEIALWNTLLLAAGVVPIQLALALFMGQIVTHMGRGRDLVLYVFVIPLGISDLAAGILWLAILEQNGFLNSALYGLGLIDGPVARLSFLNPLALFVAVALAEIWRATAIMLVILVAGMGMIPKEYNEAAEVFGASPWQRFRRVTLPLLKPSLQTALILRTILAFEVFAVVAALAGTSMPMLMGETYAWEFQLQDRGVAAAYALVILGISILATIVFLYALRTPKEARA